MCNYKLYLLLVYVFLIGGALPRGGSRDGATFTEVTPVISPGGGLMGFDGAKRINAQP